MTDIEQTLRLLSDAQVEFIVVGGVAGLLLGSARLTNDLDVAYRRSTDNLAKLVAALTPVHPYLRGAPAGLPFKWDVETLKRGLNFTLTTDLGDLDLLGEVTGGGGFESLLSHSVPIATLGRTIMVLGLDKLIEVKRAAGRPKDFEAIAELEAIREQKHQDNT